MCVCVCVCVHERVLVWRQNFNFITVSMSTFLAVKPRWHGERRNAMERIIGLSENMDVAEIHSVPVPFTRPSNEISMIGSLMINIMELERL